MENTIQTIDKLKEVFQPIADKIGQGAQFGWEVVLRQQYIEAFMGLFYGLIAVGALTVSFFWARKIMKESWDEISWIPFSIWTLAWIVLGLIGLETFIGHILNPQYYAIEFFIGLVK